MQIGEIIKAVRWCIDEESNNSSSITDEKDDVYMDNIIKAKITDALRWVCANAPAKMLSGSDNDLANGILKDYTFVKNGENYNALWNKEHGIGCIAIPSGDNFVRILRIRGSNWHRAILVPETEDSDTSLQMFNETACGTPDRPIAVIVRQNNVKFLVQPASDNIEMTVAVSPSPISQTESTDTNVVVPENIKGGFIYYLSFLLLSAYEDSRANLMYDIALQQLGLNNQQK